MMNWYRHIKLSDMSVSRPQRYVDHAIKTDTGKSFPSGKVPQDRIRLFNYLKSRNVKMTFFHGTSQDILDQIKKSGYILSATAMRAGHRESRTSGLDQVFYSTSAAYAMTYAKNMVDKTEGDGVLLKLEIPLHMITEIKDTILGVQGTYNEAGNDYMVSKIINAKNYTNEQKINKIIEYMHRVVAHDEWTTYLALSSKYIVNVIHDIIDDDLHFRGEHNKKHVLVQDKDLVASLLKSGIIEMDSVPKQFQSAPEIHNAIVARWVNYIYEHPSPGVNSEGVEVGYAQVPEELKNDPAILQAAKTAYLEALEEYSQNIPMGRLQARSVPEHLRGDPDVNNLIASIVSVYLQNSMKSATSFLDLNKLPMEWMSLPAAREAAINTLVEIANNSVKMLANMAFNGNSLPYYLIGDRRILAVVKRGWIYLLNEGMSASHAGQLMPDSIKSDPEIVQLMSKANELV